MSCGDQGIVLLGATPADGYRAEVESEHDKLEVHFQREDPEDEVQVAARCVDGTPDFSVDRHERE